MTLSFLMTPKRLSQPDTVLHGSHTVTVPVGDRQPVRRYLRQPLAVLIKESYITPDGRLTIFRSGKSYCSPVFK